MLLYDIVNVFIADGASFSGNPLAVIYGAETLSQDQCQALGRQFNLSEITFPYDLQQGAYSVRIFTPGAELPFAGHHGYVASERLLHRGFKASNGEAIQTSPSGQTKLLFSHKLESPMTPSRIRMRASPHFFTGRLPHVIERLPSVFGHATQHVQYVRRASCGLPWLYACLDSPEAVKDIRLSSSDLKQYCDELKTRITPEEGRDTWVTGLVSFAVIKNGEEGLEIKARVFFEENGVLTEDSATGSAALGLGLVLFAEELITSIAPKYKILQGYEALKPSQLYGDIEVQSDSVVAVRVAGDVVKVGEGSIAIP